MFTRAWKGAVDYQEFFPFLVKLLPVLNGPAESLMTVITIGFFFWGVKNVDPTGSSAQFHASVHHCIARRVWDGHSNKPITLYFQDSWMFMMDKSVKKVWGLPMPVCTLHLCKQWIITYIHFTVAVPDKAIFFSPLYIVRVMVKARLSIRDKDMKIWVMNSEMGIDIVEFPHVAFVLSHEHIWLLTFV